MAPKIPTYANLQARKRNTIRLTSATLMITRLPSFPVVCGIITGSVNKIKVRKRSNRLARHRYLRILILRDSRSRTSHAKLYSLSANCADVT